MSRFNTGNPLDSDRLEDLSDNAKNVDLFSNDTKNKSYTDRFGKKRRTIHSMESDFDAGQKYRSDKFSEDQIDRESQFISSQKDKQDRFNDFIVSSGYQFVGDYAAGVELTEYNQIVRDGSGEFWRVSGKTELPYILTGGGVDEGGALVSVGDASLRQDLANPDKGAAMVARGVVAVDSIADLLALPEEQRKEGLRYLVKGYHQPQHSPAAPRPGGGSFYWDDQAPKSLHDGGYIIDPDRDFPASWEDAHQVEMWLEESAATGTGCWVASNRTSVSVDEFGASDISDSTLPCQSAIRVAERLGFNLDFGSRKNYFVDVTETLVINRSMVVDLNGSVISALPTSSGGYTIFKLIADKVFLKNGSIMGERNEHTGDEGEWGFGVHISGDHCTLEDIFIGDCWGDGIYVRKGEDPGSAIPVRDTYLNNVECRNNRRQGLSIICADGFLANRCIFADTNGTLPAAGVDIEPNNAEQGDATDNMVFVDCSFLNNEGSGIDYFAGGLTVIRGIFLDNGRSLLPVLRGLYERKDRMKILRDCVAGSNKNYVALFYDPRNALVENCTIIDRGGSPNHNGNFQSYEETRNFTWKGGSCDLGGNLHKILSNSKLPMTIEGVTFTAPMEGNGNFSETTEGGVIKDCVFKQGATFQGQLRNLTLLNNYGLGTVWDTKEETSGSLHGPCIARGNTFINTGGRGCTFTNHLSDISDNIFIDPGNVGTSSSRAVGLYRGTGMSANNNKIMLVDRTTDGEFARAGVVVNTNGATVTGNIVDDRITLGVYQNPAYPNSVVENNQSAVF